MQQVFSCPRCGSQNTIGQRFCVGCGAPIANSCPYCGAYMGDTSKFCTSCGAPFESNRRQPGRQPQQTSGWAKFGGAMFVLGVLCIVIGPVLLLLMPQSEQSTRQLIICIAVGVLIMIIGLPLMRSR